MKASVILVKASSKFALENGINNVLIPKYEKSKDIVNKLSGDIKATLSQPRNLEHHEKLFAIAKKCGKNNIFYAILERWQLAKQVFDLQLEINELAIQGIRARFKQDSYSLIYICKYLFLPFEEELQPDGKRAYKISSIAFSEMDEIKFSEFYNRCLDFWAFILDINRSVLE